MFAATELSETLHLPHAPEHCEHVYNQFVVRVAERDEVRRRLQRVGVPTEIYYPHALHLQPAFEPLARRGGDLSHSEQAAAEALALPIYPELSEAQQRFVVEALARCVARPVSEKIA
jgi:dTDP-4-amino-4,6-dideoxygalactose transaminase